MKIQQHYSAPTADRPHSNLRGFCHLVVFFWIETCTVPWKNGGTFTQDVLLESEKLLTRVLSIMKQVPAVISLTDNKSFLNRCKTSKRNFRHISMLSGKKQPVPGTWRRMDSLETISCQAHWHGSEKNGARNPTRGFLWSAKAWWSRWKENLYR